MDIESWIGLLGVFVLIMMSHFSHREEQLTSQVEGLKLRNQKFERDLKMLDDYSTKRILELEAEVASLKEGKKGLTHE